MAIVDKAAQEAEAVARVQSGAVPPGETADALDVPGDVALAPAEPIARAEPEAKEPPTPPTRSKFDDKRAEITARFRESRGQEPAETEEKIDDYIRAGLPPLEPEPEAEETSAENSAENSAETGAEQAASVTEETTPRKFKLKVNGQELELSEEELIANAQKSLATDNILDKAKSKLADIDRLEQQIRQRATQPANQDGHHADPQRAAPELSPDLPDPQNQSVEDNLIETIQFGDPAEARQKLRNTIAAESSQVVKQELLAQRLRDEGARTAKLLKDFGEQHADIASDPNARAVIEVTTLQLQTEDLIALGLDPNQIRPDKQPPQPGDIAAAHRYYRAMGMSVRSPQVMLEEAVDKYQTW